MIRTKKATAIILTAALLLGACCGCSSKDIKGSDTIVFPKDELLSSYRSESDPEAQEIKGTDRAKAFHFYRGETEIYGELYKPEGDGPFPVIVISGGFATTHDSYRSMAQYYADNGFIGVVYDPSDMGEYGQKIDDFIHWSPLTEAADIESIVSALSKLPFVDDDNVFLWGHSMGGFASGYVGFKNPDLIRGLILVEPAFYLNEEAKEMFPDTSAIPAVVEGDPYFGKNYYEDLCSFDIYEYMPKYDHKVVIFGGMESPSIGTDEPEIITKAGEKLPSCKIVYVYGADHYFSGIYMNKVIKDTVDIVKENLKE